MTVGEKIRKFRIDQGYTQKELAIMSGLSESAIRNYELGNRFPSSEQLEKIANSLKISPYAMSDPNKNQSILTRFLFFKKTSIFLIKRLLFL